MESTRQITKAMEMVASSKLRKAQNQALSARPYFETLYETIHAIADSNSDFSSPYLTERAGDKALFVVIAGDRGLAGGYNSNVLKLVTATMADKQATVLPIGKKALDYFAARRQDILTDAHADAANVSSSDCFTVAKQICKRFLAGDFDQVYVAYTNFVSVLSQTPSVLRLLPLIRQPRDSGVKSDMLYEPDSTTVFEQIIPEYIGGILYGALCESRASEQAARRTAMDSATQNADEMIDKLSLEFNRARQAAITQEITEIVAGS